MIAKKQSVEQVIRLEGLEQIQQGASVTVNINQQAGIQDKSTNINGSEAELIEQAWQILKQFKPPLLKNFKKAMVQRALSDPAYHDFAGFAILGISSSTAARTKKLLGSGE